MSLAATGAQAQETVNICDRTQQVVDEILRDAVISSDACDSVSVSEMANLISISLRNKSVIFLQSGDFDGLSELSILDLSDNNLTELQDGIFSGLPKLATLILVNTSLTTLSSSVFSDLPALGRLALTDNQLRALPDGIFSGLTSLAGLTLDRNPGADFQFTVRFEPETLEEDFTAEPVRLVLREGAPRRITVPLLITGPGGELMAGSPDSLTFGVGSTQTASVTVIRGEGHFRLAQGELELSRETGVGTGGYSGFEIVRGPPITLGGVPVRVKVFLEGALE